MTGKRLKILEIGPGEFPNSADCENVSAGVMKTNDFWQCLRKYLVFLAVYQFPLSGQAALDHRHFVQLQEYIK